MLTANQSQVFFHSPQAKNQGGDDCETIGKKDRFTLLESEALDLRT